MTSGLARYKAAFAQGRVHLNNAGLAPISRPARDALVHWAERFYQEGFATDADYMAATEATRAGLAALIGAQPARVAFFASTALAMSQVAFGCGLQPGDEVLTFDQEYGSNLFPWREACKRAGARLRLAPAGPHLSAPLAGLLALVTPATRVIAVSSVQYQTGAVVDLPALSAVCRERGIYLCVDAMQSVGWLPIAMDGLHIDAVCGGSHKWLTSPVGVGYLAVSERLAAKLTPLALGAQSFGSCDLPTAAVCGLKPDLTALEPGSKATAEILALGASVDLVATTGVTVIGAEVERLACRLGQGLRERGYKVLAPHAAADQEWTPADQRGGIVTFAPEGAARWSSCVAVADALRQHGILPALRGGGVRLSPHAFNTDADIDAALAVL